MSVAGPGLPARDPVAGIFDFGQKGSISAPSSSVFSPFDGFTMGPGVKGGSLPLPGILGDSAATYRKGNMWGFDQDNGAMVKQYVSAHKSIPALKDDTGVGQILYSCNPRMKKHIQAQEIGRGRSEEPQFAGVREALEFKSLSRLNRWLRSKEGRQMFGKDSDCMRLRQTYRMAGVQITKAHDSLSVNDEFVLAIVVGRRARTKDFTVIGGKGAQMNDVVFIVWRRFEYTGVPLPDRVAGASKKNMSAFQRLIAERVDPEDDMDESSDEPVGEAKSQERLLERIKALKKAQSEIKTSHVIKKKMGITEPGMVTDKSTDKEYYWQGDMWYGPRGTRPNEKLYLTDSFIGDIDFVGLVVEVYGDRSTTLVNESNAKLALHPTTDTDEWKKALVALPDLEIHLRVR